MAKRKALITGVSGQDGSYLSELLLEKGYKVYGMVRRTSSSDWWRISHLMNDIELVSGDLTDQSSLNRLMAQIQPDEVYNLAAQSFVAISWEQPVYTANVTAVGALHLLEAIRESAPRARFYQASSSEMFGKAQQFPQNENTPFHPRSPYGVAKVYAHYITMNYRESYNMYACSGILFNHESPRRGPEFVTRKISSSVARIKAGLQDKLALGNREVRRDWGFAGDYVRAMWLMMQQDKPSDYVIGSGENYSVQDFVSEAFAVAGLPWEKHVTVDQAFFRPAEVEVLLSDPSRAQHELGWSLEVDFQQLVRMMVRADIERLKQKGTLSL